MSYVDCAHLPDYIQDDLPPEGQELYRVAFNLAWDKYEDEEKRDKDYTREELSHMAAWREIKDHYRQRENGKWVKK
ncbi:ChaB family protein [Aliiglaciecola sp. CAU 1673]|uniref:ChaB family protein n=1 Tax=Aliiglaciecola sp. CAU 1673 TaxID=3032595 RepID=UPI0023DB00A7|nr:ChaB family protein [Aliiglaciecola sp. CAU 1673]MDF2176730.1 ChaB family protein [Aliiglaciecola sp. CAU 1673]